MYRVLSVILAVVYGVVFSGFRLFEEVADFPTAPYPPDYYIDYIDESSGAAEVSVVGTWYNSDDLREEWVFSPDGVLTVGGTNAEKREYSVRTSRGGTVLVIDGVKYDCYISYDREYMSLVDENHSGVVLYSGESEYYQTQIKELIRNERLETECAELFSRYPDNSGWIESMYTGDIPFLADADIIDRMLQDGFVISTPEELASCCWYVNTNDAYRLAVTISADIDLSGYEWAPMGWGNQSSDYPFRGYVDGGGHTIKNMTVKLDTAGSCAGFIGWEIGCVASNIRFEGAKVSGGYAGVVTGQAIGGSYYNITVTHSEVTGNHAGAMLGWDAHTIKENCCAEVTVNGEKAEQLSWNDSEKSKITVENKVEITLDENYVAHRPEVEDYDMFSWVIERDGRELYCNSALGSYTYDCQHSYPGTYKVYLQAWINGQYMPISNIISYTISD